MCGPPVQMTGGVDLHSHTTASDGTLTPRELVRAAARRGVRVLAVTDHDSTDGLGDAVDEAARHPPLTIVPGLEINCDVPGAEVHVLGYYVEVETPWFPGSSRRASWGSRPFTPSTRRRRRRTTPSSAAPTAWWLPGAPTITASAAAAPTRSATLPYR